MKPVTRLLRALSPLSTVLILGTSITFPAHAGSTSGTSLVRTIVVDPVPGNPRASGQALRLAVDGIAGASSNDPYLVKVGPGIFQLGVTDSAALSMKPWVDIEGSGEGVTIIRSGGFSTNFLGTIITADNSELRRLTVENQGGAPDAIAILNLNSAATIDHVTAIATGGTERTYGIRNFGSGNRARMRDVTAIATGSGQLGSGAYGVSVKNVTHTILERVRASASGASRNQAVSILEELGATFKTDLDGVIAEATGPGSNSGLWINGNVEVTVTRSNLSASGSSSAIGVEILDYTFTPVRISHSTLSGGSGTGLSSFGNAELDQSRVFGETFTLFGGVLAGASRLDGGPALHATCAGVYDESYVFFPSSCP